MLTILAIASVVGLISASVCLVLLLNLSRQRAVTPRVNFSCPYCSITVTGAKELDLINHVACVMRSESDLETLRKKAIVAPKDEYLITYQALAADGWRDKGSNVPENVWTYTNGKYRAYHWVLYRNGETIQEGYATYKDNAAQNAKAAQTLDEYKRRNKHKRAIKS